ncbi:hypothetical protein [Streptomyces sp. NBC_01426]|uniref:hypothetical protein n=1 Tax=Streptomyces sp. NBC_01426 TaxID=2975866 RepID=UPI003FCD3DC8
MTKAIGVAGLHKAFGRTPALDGLDLGVTTGEVHGYSRARNRSPGRRSSPSPPWQRP